MDDLTRLVEAEEIKRVKGRYCRAVDAGQWDELATYVTEDFCSFVTGYGELRGREVVIDQTRAGYEVLGDEGWEHHAILPDIEITSATTATGVWTFGAGRYNDEYVKEDGKWKIKATRVLR